MGFLKNWTLPVAMGLGTLLYLLFASMPALQKAGAFFDSFFGELMPVFMFLVLFVTFCKVDFHQMKLQMWHLWVTLFQLLFVLVVVAVILSVAKEGDNKVLWEGILCCIICPSASAAAVVTAKLGGDIGSMTAYTFLSNFMAALMIPLFFPLIEKGVNITFLTAFWTILQKVMLILVAPLVFGWFVRNYVHWLYKRIMGISNLAFYLWGCLLSIVTGMTVKNIVNSHASASLLVAIAAVSLLLCIWQFAVGKYIGHFSRSAVNAGQALGQKNTAFAIWTAYTYLNSIASVGPGCYILWQNIVNSWEIWLYRKHNAEQPDNKARA